MIRIIPLRVEHKLALFIADLTMLLSFLLALFLNSVVFYLFKSSSCGPIVSALQHLSAESIRGNRVYSSRIVVFSQVPAGFANNMMCLLSSYAVAIALDLPLACNRLLSILM